MKVERGDSLWGLASAQLGSGARPAAVAAQTKAWYTVNRATIGDDPNLVLTGSKLIVPTKGTDK